MIKYVSAVFWHLYELNTVLAYSYSK